MVEKSFIVKEESNDSEAGVEVDISLNRDNHHNQDTSHRTMNSQNSVLFIGDVIQNSDAVNLKINHWDKSKCGEINKYSSRDAGMENLGSYEDVKSPLQLKVEEKENETESNMTNNILSIRNNSSDHPNHSSIQDPLMNLHDAINIMEYYIKKEEEMFIYSNQDFDKELNTDQDSVPELKSHDPQSSGESDSDEKSLHITKENVTPSRPAITDGASEMDRNKSKRKVSDLDKPCASENPSKKLCKELEASFEEHNAMIADCLKNTSNCSIEEIDKHTDFLQLEIQTLKDLAQAKENEWNNIIHLRKVKEEILIKLLRKKKIILLDQVNHDITSTPYTSSTTPSIVQESRPLSLSQSFLSSVSRNITSSSVSIPITALPTPNSIYQEFHPLSTSQSLHSGVSSSVSIPIATLPTPNIIHEESHPLPTSQSLHSGVSRNITSSSVSIPIATLPTPNIIHEESHPFPSSQSLLSGVSRNITSSASIPQFCNVSPSSNLKMPLDKNVNNYGNKKIVPKSLAKVPEKNGEIENFMLPRGRQGAIKDVKSLIAEYRSKHPEKAPRGGKSSKNIAKSPVSILPRPASPINLRSWIKNKTHLTIGDSGSSQYTGPGQQITSSLSNGLGFKDLLVQYPNVNGSWLGQSETNGPVSNLPSSAPLEVTLHPAGNSIGGVKVIQLPQPHIVATPQQQLAQMTNLSQQQTNSLLHGYIILNN